MKTIIFNNNCEQSSDVRSNQGIFIIKIADINNNVRNSKLRHGKITVIQRVKSFLLACYEDLSDISIQLKHFILVDTLLDTNSKVRTKYAPKTYVLTRTYLIIRHVRREFCQSIKKEQIKDVATNFETSTRARARGGDNYNLSDRYIANPKAINIAVVKKRVRIRYPLFDLLSFSRQASFTHELKLPFPATNSIFASKSSSKRICFVVLFGRSKCFLSFLSCIGSYRYDKLNLKGSYHYISNYFKKAMPRSAGTLSRHLTTNIKDTNAMANSNNTLHPKNGQQSKLFKFYDRATTQIVQSIAISERQARKNLGKQSLIFIARTPLNPTFERSTNWGGYSHA